MNETTKKWNETGLLDKLTDSQKDKCAVILNCVAECLIRDDPNPTDKEKKKQHEEFCGHVLPMARRIYDRLYTSNLKFPDIEWFVKDCREFFDNNQEFYNDCNSYIAMDGVAQMCEIYEQDCMEKITNGKQR